MASVDGDSLLLVQPKEHSGNRSLRRMGQGGGLDGGNFQEVSALQPTPHLPHLYLFPWVHLMWCTQALQVQKGKQRQILAGALSWGSQ